MENINKYIKLGITTIATGATWFFGAWDTALSILLLFMVADYISGVVNGFINKKLSSDIGYRGIAKKGGILVVLIIGVSLDRLLNDGTWVFRTLVAYWYIANEGISLLENLGAIGVPIPPQILDVLIQLKEGGKKEIKSN